MKNNEQEKVVNNKIAAGSEDVWRLLGLAVRAGQVASGAEAVSQSVRRQKARLVILAEDASENTAKKLTRLCRNADVPVRRFGPGQTIGHWTGHPARAVIAVREQGFAARLISLIDCLEKPVR